MRAADISDFRELARRRLPRFLFDYVDGGSYAEITLRRNVEDLSAIALRQQVLRDVSQVDLSTEILGQKMTLPVALAPVGLAGLLARRGEVQAARAAAAAGVPLCLSTVSACAIDEVADGSPAPFWFQLYMVRDRGFIRELIGKAKARRCPVLILTVDLPMPGARYRDYRSGLSGQDNLWGAIRRALQVIAHPHWAFDVALNGRPLTLGNLAPVIGKQAPMSDFLAWIGRNFDPSLNWKDLDWVRQEWSGPLLVKGILDPVDAELCARAGAQGIVVSNHGGRQLDGVLSAAKALPAIADKVGDRLTILADGGVRSGLDVFRLLALGAKGVLLGRAYAYALAAGGEAGIRQMLQMIASEMRIAMSLTGCVSVREANREFLVP
jgi:L-lactate dehydrogenase (cytochrome)